MKIKIGRKYKFEDWNSMYWLISADDKHTYIGDVYTSKENTPFHTNFTIPKSYCEKFLVPYYIEVKDTRLARKLYPNAIEEDGMLIIEE